MTNQSTDKLTSVLLDGKNYNMWVRQVSFGLFGIDKFEYVNGEFTMPVPSIIGEPTENEKKANMEWRKSDNRVVASLLATMELLIFKVMIYQKTIKQMWDKVKKLYDKRKKSLSYLSASIRTSLNKATTKSIYL
jgi:gag-polypeptide of LTR copia-type